MISSRFVERAHSLVQTWWCTTDSPIRRCLPTHLPPQSASRLARARVSATASAISTHYSSTEPSKVSEWCD
ncbi:UNVERIFIED_CONTAM: hypothetical protein GTU68_024103 [Idotea baltica]|nr:hypothetical protein [Idotea baltica]